MNIDITPLYDNQHYSHASIIIGANGSGKSRLLRRLSERFIATGRPVVVICNTVYDRFRCMRGIEKLRPHSQLPLTLMKDAITCALKDGPFRLRGIADTLHYLGYSSDIGLEIQDFNPEKVSILEMFIKETQPRALIPQIPSFEDMSPERDELYELNLSPNQVEEIISTVELSKRIRFKDIYWLDFLRDDFKKFEYEALARLIKWEKVLKRIGVLRGVSISLKRKNGAVFDLREASSGELTLLTTFTHLAINFAEGGVLIVDEPENSLHPNWQHNYVPRLLDILNVRSPTIYVATHSPIVVSGARTLAAELTAVFRADNGVASFIDNIEDSLEGTLVEVFGTVTPKNHYVSLQLADSLGALSRGEITLDQVENKILLYEKSSYSKKQQDFLSAVNLMAHKVAAESTNG